MSTSTVYQRATDQRWWAASTLNRKRRAVYATSEADARRELAVLQRQVAQVGDLPDAGRRSLGDLLDAYLTAASGALRPRTRADCELLAVRYIRPVLGAVRLNRLQPDHLQRRYLDLPEREPRRAPAQVHALRFAVLWHWPSCA